MSAMLTLDTIVELREEIVQLARDMVRLERWAKEAAERRKFNRVGELHMARDQVRECRSALMRELWELRRAR